MEQLSSPRRSRIAVGLAAVGLCSLMALAADPQPMRVLPGSEAQRAHAEPDDTSAVYVIRTGKETLEWRLAGLASGLYCVEMRVRTGNTDSDPLNLVRAYRLAAIGDNDRELAGTGFAETPGLVPKRTSKEWPHFVGDIRGTSPLRLTPDLRLRVSIRAHWAEVQEIRLYPAASRERLAVHLTATAPFALVHRPEPIPALVRFESFWDEAVTPSLHLELISPYGQLLDEKRAEIQVPAQGTIEYPVSFASSLNGCHYVRLQARLPQAGGEPFEYTAEVPVGVVTVAPAGHLSVASPFGVHPAELSEMYQCGFRWIRLWDTGDVWSAHERQGKGRFDFAATEAKVENFRRGGFEVLAVLGYTPTWASTHPEIGYYAGAGAPFPPRDLQDWRDYCREYMTRFRGRICHFEVWNEPNTGDVADLNNGFFRGTVTDYVALLKAAFETAREVDPQIRIAGGSGTGDFLDWTERVLANGGGPYLDILSFHAYTTPSSPEEANLEGRLDRLRQIMEKHGVANLPVWNTEVGYWQDGRDGARPMTADQLLGKAPPGLAPNWTPDWPYRPIPEDEAAAYTVRHYYLNAAKGIERLFWYSSSPSGFPLLCDDNSLRLAGFAVAAAAHELEGYRYWRRIDLGQRRLHLHLWRAGDRVKAIAWHADRGSRRLVLQPTGPLTAVDLWGNPRALQTTAEGTVIEAGRDPVILTGTVATVDSARLRSREIVIPVDDCHVVHEQDPARPVKNHTSPAYHGDRRVFGLPDAGDAIGWRLTGISPGQYQVEVELRTGDAANLYGSLTWYQVEVGDGDQHTPLQLAPVEASQPQPQAITTKEGGDRAYGWARAGAPVWLGPTQEIRVTLAAGFGFVGALRLREQAAGLQVLPLAALTSAPTIDGKLDEATGLARLALNTRRQVVIGVADPFASTSERDAWRGPDDLSASFVAAQVGTAGLYVAVEVTDGGGVFPAEKGPFNGDCIELFLDLRSPQGLGTPVLGEQVYQLMLRAPGTETESRIEARTAPGAQAMARRTPAGYAAEFLVPVTGLATGRQIGLDLAVDDDDTGQGRKTQIVFHGTRDNFQDPSAYARFVCR